MHIYICIYLMLSNITITRNVFFPTWQTFWKVLLNEKNEKYSIPSTIISEVFLKKLYNQRKIAYNYFLKNSLSKFVRLSCFRRIIE